MLAAHISMPHLIGHMAVTDALHPLGLLVEHLELGRIEDIVVVVVLFLGGTVVVILSRLPVAAPVLIRRRVARKYRYFPLPDAGQIRRGGIHGLILVAAGLAAAVGRVRSEAAGLLVGRALFRFRRPGPGLGGLTVVSHLLLCCLIVFAVNWKQTEI